MGVRHPNGSLGMVVDPTVKRLLEPRRPDDMIPHYKSSRSRNRHILCPKPNRTHGIEGEGGNPVMHRIRRVLTKARANFDEQVIMLWARLQVTAESHQFGFFV